MISLKWKQAPVVLVDGRLEVIWDYDQQRSHIIMKIEMFTPPTATIKRGIAAEAKRFGEFLNNEVRLDYLQS